MGDCTENGASLCSMKLPPTKLVMRVRTFTPEGINIDVWSMFVNRWLTIGARCCGVHQCVQVVARVAATGWAHHHGVREARANNGC
jgi:hypothetical protein